MVILEQISDITSNRNNIFVLEVHSMKLIQIDIFKKIRNIHFFSKNSTFYNHLVNMIYIKNQEQKY